MSDAPEVTLVAEFATATDFDKKHTPFITLAPHGASTVVTVEVGHEIAHPNEADHYITDIELFTGDASIARFDLSPVNVSPKVSIVVNLPVGTVLRAVERCNLHGLFAYEVTL